MNFRNTTNYEFRQTYLSTLIRNKLSANIHLLFAQIFVNLDGVILKASAISRAKPAQTGQMRYQNVNKQTPFLLMWTAMKRMYTSNTDIMARNRGWDWTTDQQKVTLLGRILDGRTLQLGRRTSQIISEKKIVFMPLVWGWTTSGMTCGAATVISILVRKVRSKSF